MPKPTSGPVRHLWLLRHGKAASDAPWGGGDRERPLTGRGRRDASALGERLADEDPVLGLEGVPRPRAGHLLGRGPDPPDRRPDRQGHWATGFPLDSFRSLYGADTELVLRYLREIDEGVRSALVVGHNPTMYELVWELLADRGDDEPVERPGRARGARLPHLCAGRLVLGVRAWEDVAHGCGRLAGLFKPPY